MFRAAGISLLFLFTAIALPTQPTHGGGNGQSIKVGIIGLDTSHVTAFTKILHNPTNTGNLAGLKVVAAYPGGSPDIAMSRDRIEGFTKQMKESYGVEIIPGIDELLKRVDVVLLESVDGRCHLAQAEPVILAGKPLFIDKPMAASLTDVIKIFTLAKKHNVPCFSSSSLRFHPELVSTKANPKVGYLVGADVFAPCSIEEHHPDLMWYGVHGVEMLYSLMGTGCEKAVRTRTQGTDVVTGVWKGGRVGTFRGLRDGKADYGATVFGSKGLGKASGSGSYEPLVAEICKFARTGKAPVSADETIEIFTFMEAAEESQRQGSAPVTLQSVLAKAMAKI
jgi:predicted dehydrogenase